ncbi:MAG TPA: hypothetical protein DCS29_02095 [Candidatus Magasanikbacteria bacterium]|nr:MAG: hypothetical protein A2479_00415 [Candidatus Magasanikbacteria bacterium RIFOXYC2_FULL_39_8]HAT03547.1 hypothetical protein [Candidatus Magasanikbacteria bacterium]
MKNFLKRPAIYYSLIIIILFLGQFLFISPIGEFALNDDWVHTEIMKHWVDSGEFRMSTYAGPTFYVPILYGAALTKIFGFSFSILRISTLILALGTLLTFNFLLYKLNHKPHINLLIVLALWFNPIFYNLSFTFMTDIPALFLFVVSLYFYSIAFTEKKPLYILGGSLFSIIGFYTRQTNILLMVAAGIYSLTQLKNIPLKHSLWSFGIPSILWLIIYIFLDNNNLLPQGSSYHTVASSEMLKHILWWIWYSLIYLGFFSIPFAMGYAFKRTKSHFKNWKLLLTIFTTVIIAIVIRQMLKTQFPYVMNIITQYGLGGVEYTLNGILKSIFSSKIWGIITLTCAASGGWLLYIMGKNKQPNQKIQGLFYVFGFIYLIPILIFQSFDRYYLPLFIIMGIIIAQYLTFKKISALVAIAILIGFAFFSINQTAFYLNWNKTRWKLANNILYETRIEPYHIDAGYEWNGWHTYWSAYEAQQNGTPHGAWNGPWWIRNIFVNNTQNYIVSFSPLEPYKIKETKKIPGWNPNNTLYLLEKTEEN